MAKNDNDQILVDVPVVITPEKFVIDNREVKCIFVSDGVYNYVYADTGLPVK